MQYPLQVYLRKRPLFQYEIDKGEFDVVAAVEPRHIVLHGCQVAPVVFHPTLPVQSKTRRRPDNVHHCLDACRYEAHVCEAQHFPL